MLDWPGAFAIAVLFLGFVVLVLGLAGALPWQRRDDD